MNQRSRSGKIDISTLHKLSTVLTKHNNIYISIFLHLESIDNFKTTRTSHKSVFKVDEHDEDGVEDGEGGDELVEGGVHLLGGQHQDGQQVPHQPEHAHHRLTHTHTSCQTLGIDCMKTHRSANDISRKFSQYSRKAPTH